MHRHLTILNLKPLFHKENGKESTRRYFYHSLKKLDKYSFADITILLG